MRKPSRTYIVTVINGGRGGAAFIEYCGCWKSTRRIREFVVAIFRRYSGGREPQSHWAADGMGEAHGHNLSIDVYQENWYLYGPGQTLAARPLCPMRLKEAA